MNMTSDLSGWVTTQRLRRLHRHSQVSAWWPEQNVRLRCWLCSLTTSWTERRHICAFLDPDSKKAASNLITTQKRSTPWLSNDNIWFSVKRQPCVFNQKKEKWDESEIRGSSEMLQMLPLTLKRFNLSNLWHFRSDSDYNLQKVQLEITINVQQ